MRSPVRNRVLGVVVALLLGGCDFPKSADGPDAAVDGGYPTCNAKAKCKDFCYLGESSYKCDDNKRCVCDYKRDGAEALIDCIGP